MESRGPYHGMRVELDEGSGLCTVWLARPKVNAFSRAMLEASERLFAALSDDDRVRGVLVRSESKKVFSAGLDLKDAKGLGSAADVAPYVRLIGSGLSAPRQCTKPVACAIEGHAIAGGMVLACACDYVALGRGARGAVCGVTEVNIGMVFPRVAIELVRHHTGGGRGFRRFAQDGVTVGFEEAFGMGFGDALVDDPVADAKAWLEHKMPLVPSGIWRITKRQLNHPYYQQLNDPDPLRAGSLSVEEQDGVCTHLMTGRPIPSRL